MKFEVISRTGIGMLKFGMTADEIRRAMALPVFSFYKSAEAKMPTDAFLDNTVQVFYRPPGVCEAVEIYLPMRAAFQGLELLGEPYAIVRSCLLKIDEHLEEDDSCLTSRTLGIGIYAPSHTEFPYRNTESVIAFEEGYYERYGL